LLFNINSVNFIENSTCDVSIDNSLLTAENLQYYDKDGYDLTPLELSYYRAKNYPLNKFLRIECFQQPFINLKFKDYGLYLEHSMLQHRCDFTGEAKEQLLKYLPNNKLLYYPLSCCRKWGYDFALDLINDRGIMEVLHVEIDTYNYNEACRSKEDFEKFVLKTDWEDAAEQIWKNREYWMHLEGFAQNDWKARFFGFTKAERTQKSI
jgi:hypothetical protein